MEFKQKQIWLINFDPSFGHEYKKVRPAIIVEDSQYIQTGNLLTVVPISSKIEKQAELDVYLAKDEKNRLMKDSLIKIQQISSFDKRRFIKYIGDCSQEVFKNLKENIKKYLALSEPDNQKKEKQPDELDSKESDSGPVDDSKIKDKESV